MSAEESMVDVYIYETQQLLQNLENVLLVGEGRKQLAEEDINEVFRAMHTIKGASAMMEYDNITLCSHALEDVFSLIRDTGATEEEWPKVFDQAFQTVSFINAAVARIQSCGQNDQPDNGLADSAHALLAEMKANRSTEKVAAVTEISAASTKKEECTGAEDGALYYMVKVIFETNCQMETIRAFGVLNSLSGICGGMASVPENLDDSGNNSLIIDNGFLIYIRTAVNPDEIKTILDETLFVEKYSILPLEAADEEIPESIRRPEKQKVQIVHDSAPAGGESQHMPKTPNESKLNEVAEKAAPEVSAKQNFISVNVNKLDRLLDLVGGVVTAQSMVVSTANLSGKHNDSFDAATKQLKTLIKAMQDVVMDIRMLPVSTVFQKMKRLVRDMAKKEDKDIELVLIGEETEVDKNVIDCLSDPLMHLIRNAVDHGIEDRETRIKSGKPAMGRIVLDAHTTGNDVIVTISDDGKGLQREAILKKAYEKGLISKSEKDISDKDVYNLIFLPGFSTKDCVTEFSGRGVGMDVVQSNISKISGSLTVDSKPGEGTTFTIRIPLTLTIVDGIKFNVGNISFIMPTPSVQMVLKPAPGDVFTDTEGNEMIILHDKCYSVARMSKMFDIKTAVTKPEDGMIMQLISNNRDFCILFDSLDGEYQVVAKALPSYLKKCATRLEGISGCAILGDGSINLILDVNQLVLDR